jgi:hypothetical protein
MSFTRAMQQSDFRSRPSDSGEEALPLPTGTAIYDSLTTKFVAFPRLLETLAETSHSGYVKLVAPGANGIVLLREGQVIDSLFRAPETLLRGSAALDAVQTAVAEGEGVLDIVALEPGIVDGLHGVASGRTMYPELIASWVNAEGLVSYLKELGFSGSLIVTSQSGQGVVIFEGGRVSASFTTESRELAPNEKEVLALCADKEARLEVRELERAAADSNGSVANAVSAVFEGE